MSMQTDLYAEYASQDGDDNDRKPTKLTPEQIERIAAEERQASAVERAIEQERNEVWRSSEEIAAEMDRKMGW